LTSLDNRAIPARQWSVASVRSPPTNEVSASLSICPCKATGKRKQESDPALTSEHISTEGRLGHTSDFMLEVAEEPFLEWYIRALDCLVLGHGWPASLLEFGLRHDAGIDDQWIWKRFCFQRKVVQDAKVVEDVILMTSI